MKRSFLSVLLVLVFAPLLALAAQESPSAQPPAPTAPRPAPAASQQQRRESLRGELAEASERAAGEEESQEKNANFKYSGSVNWIARKTGLALIAAYWLAISVNFAVIAGLIIWLWRSHLPQMFRARTATIQQGIEEARKASQEANRRMSEVEARLSRLDSEISALRADAESEAAQEEQRIRQAAETDTRKIVQAAEQEIEAISRLARRELKAYAAELAVSLAEKRIQVDAAADRAIVGRFVDRLGNGARRK